MSLIVRSYASTNALPSGVPAGTVASVAGVLYSYSGSAWAALTLSAGSVTGKLALSKLADGTNSGDVLTWSGSAWASQAVSASGGFTRTAVTGNTTLSGTGNQIADVTTLGANLTVTLPAATSGQIIVVADSTNAAGSGSFIAKIAANGSETFGVSGGSATALYLSEDGGSVMLAGTTGTGWRVIGGRGYAVDPRSISGLYVWLDARRGLTLATQRQVSAWADFSGNGRNFAQGTGANQPIATRLPGSGALPAVFFDAASGNKGLASSATQTINSGSFTGLFLVASPPPASDATYRTLWAHNYAATTGFGVYLSAGAASGAVWNTYDSLFFGKGSQSGQTPMATGSWSTSGVVPAIRGTAPHVLAGRLGASSTGIYGDGVSLIQKTIANGTCGTVTAQTIYLGCGQGGATEMSNAHLASVIVFDSVLSDADFALLQADLMRQAGAR